MKKLISLPRKKFSGYFTCVFLFVIICLLPGCNSGDNSSEMAGSSETGSLSFSIVWPDAADKSVLKLAKAQAVDCDLIQYIVCEVYDAWGNDLTTETFDCTAGQGTVTSVPVGLDLEVVILALDVNGEILFHANVPGVTVSTNETNNLGEIEMNNFYVSQLLAPEDQSSVTEGDVSFQWSAVPNATEYNILVGTDSSLDTVILSELTPNTTFTPSESLETGDYFWRVIPIDAHQNAGAASATGSFSVIPEVECNYDTQFETDFFPSAGGTGSISVTTNEDVCEWSASSSKSWVTFTNNSGIGSGTVDFSVSANTAEEGRTATITIAGQVHSITQTGTSTPDLVVDVYLGGAFGDFSVTPKGVQQGGSVTFSPWIVTNQGTAAAEAFESGFYLSTDAEITTNDIYLGKDSNAGLPSSEFSVHIGTTVTIPEETEAGSYYIGILVDRDEDILESDETNNYISVPITIGKPDLVITTGSPGVEPSTVEDGESVTIDAWTVQNQGGSATGPFSNGYYLSKNSRIDTNDTLLSSNTSVSSSGLSSGGEKTYSERILTIPEDTDWGTYYIGILVDIDGDVSESNESNNYVSQKITIGKKDSGSAGDEMPDLVITSGSMTVEPTTQDANGDVTISGWTIKNQGSADAESFYVGFYLSTDAVITKKDDWLGSTQWIKVLESGDTQSFSERIETIPYLTDPGNYYIGILVDWQNNVDESDEDNNYVSTPLTVTPVR